MKLKPPAAAKAHHGAKTPSAPKAHKAGGHHGHKGKHKRGHAKAHSPVPAGKPRGFQIPVVQQAAQAARRAWGMAKAMTK